MGKRRRKPMGKKVRELVVERSGGMCEAGCGRAAENIHHRRFLGRGGKHNIGNLVALCGQGNASGCHGRAHGTGEPAPAGWAISAWERRTEAEVPFVDVHGVTWFFDDYGNKETDDFKELET